jgi:hypothetical protein
LLQIKPASCGLFVLGSEAGDVQIQRPPTLAVAEPVIFEEGASQKKGRISYR